MASSTLRNIAQALARLDSANASDYKARAAAYIKELQALDAWMRISRRALEMCLPYLNSTVSSWGPDYIFPKLLGYPKDKIAIVDETPVIHARPVAMGPNIALAKELGADPNKELQAFLRLLRAHAPLRYLGRDHQRRTLYDGPLRDRSFQGRAGKLRREFPRPDAPIEACRKAAARLAAIARRITNLHQV
jgi:Zinc-uptake complex component A periplasmic